ncbi:MAG: 3-dehydroquinate synthase II [Deltaproteobacteria bacterium]|nr:3-dehydroquinate synthase II [Deltaproteobacteria bacterium]
MTVPRLWARVIPWDKEVAVSALESGVPALWVPDGCASQARALGRVVAVCADGDLREGTDFRVTRMDGKEDESRIAASSPDAVWVVYPAEREIIPLENLVAWGRRILAVAKSPEEVALYRGVLEQGVHGLVLSCPDPAGMRALAAAAGARAEDAALVAGEVAEIVPLGMGDRVCVDTCTWIEGSRGMLVGNGSAGLFLVCAENVPNPYVLPRPFRVNAGAVHSYCRVPGGRTAYLSELAAGSGVLLVDASGKGEVAWVGRVKVERRPLVLIRAVAPSGNEHSVVLQNAETIRLVGPGGAATSVARIAVGDRILLMEERSGRHFGVAVEETIREK